MNRGIKKIIADLMIDNQMFREFFDVRDYFDIFNQLAKIEKEYKSLIQTSTNVWFNLYEQVATITFDYTTNDWNVTSKGKINFFREVHVKGDIDSSLRDHKIINQMEIIREIQN